MGNSGVIPNVYLTPNQVINKSGVYTIYDTNDPDPGLEIEQVNTNNTRKRSRTSSNNNSIGQFIVDVDTVVLKGIKYFNVNENDYVILPFTHFNKTTEGIILDVDPGKVLVLFFWKSINEMTVYSYANYDLRETKRKSLDPNTYYTMFDRCSDGNWVDTIVQLITMKDVKMIEFNYRMGDFTHTVYTHIFSINPLLLECRGLYDD